MKHSYLEKSKGTAKCTFYLDTGKNNKHTREQANDESTSTLTSLFPLRCCCSSVGLSEEPEVRRKPDPCLGRTCLSVAVVKCPSES